MPVGGVVGCRAVQLWPDGFSEADRGFVSIFLNRIQGPNFKVKFIFSANSRDGDRISLGKQDPDCVGLYADLGTTANYDDSSRCLGYGKFLHRRFLTDRRERFYEDGMLDLVIEMEIKSSNQGQLVTQELLEDFRSSCRVEERTEPLDEEEECVICLSNRITSGFAHGLT